MDGTEALASRVIDTPIGPMLLEAGERGLRRARFLDFPHGAGPRDGAGSGHAGAAARQLAAYFAGALREFTVPLDLAGTPFQRSVWDALLAIPYGRTVSYRQLADRVGSPRGFRAVGAANGANPVAIIVPCHRVIANDGTLGGYGGGLDRKRRLLDLETSRERLFAGA